MVKRRIYDQDRHAHFVTFTCFRRRGFLHPDRAKRIVIGSMGSQLSRQKRICSGFVVMPNHVHALVWLLERPTGNGVRHDGMNRDNRLACQFPGHRERN